MSPSETSATMGVIASATVVRGRDAELAAIGVQLDRVRSGAGAAVLVEGEPGMGKSRLLAESARIARRLGFRVGTGVAEPNTRAVELAPLMTALFDGPDPLLNRADPHDLRSVADQRYWLLPVGHFPPNGGRVVFELINIFRYDDQGRLAEEWVQTDHRSRLRQLAAEGR